MATKPSPAPGKPLIAIIMGSASDGPTMRLAADLLDELHVPYEMKVLSAHRTPDQLLEYAAGAEQRGLKVIIAAAGGAAHLAGITAAKTLLPVLGVPMESKALRGLDSLLSTVQMPKGVPVGTLAIGEPGAANAALLAVAILALNDPALHQRLQDFRQRQAQAVLAAELPR